MSSDPSKRLGCLKNGSLDIKKHSWYRSISLVNILDVDWTLLEGRKIDPPWLPPLKDEMDTEFFDEVEEEEIIETYRGDEQWTKDF